MLFSNTNDRLEGVVQMFADQFEETPTGWLYRYKHKGAPIEVSAEERAGFIQDVRVELRRLTWAAVVLLGAALVALVAHTIANDIELEGRWIAGTLVGFAPPYYVAFQRIWNAPRRALAKRTAVGRARTKDELRRFWAAKTSWGQLAAALAGAAFLIWSQSRGHSLLEGWHRLWMVFGAGILVGVGWSASNKLRAGNRT